MGCSLAPWFPLRWFGASKDHPPRSKCVAEKPLWTGTGQSSFGKASDSSSVPLSSFYDITLLWLLHVKHVKLLMAREALSSNTAYE